jgi:hypothetical protein
LRLASRGRREMFWPIQRPARTSAMPTRKVMREEGIGMTRDEGEEKPAEGEESEGRRRREPIKGMKPGARNVDVL